MGELIKSGVACTRVITVFDLADAPKTGLVDADFTTQTVTKNGAVSALGITITEINAGTRPGQYTVAFTPDADAEWYIRVAHPTYAVRGFIFEFTSTADGPLAKADITASVPTVAQIRTEMDSNSADLNTIIAGIATILGAIPSENDNADALLDRASAIDGKTVREALRYIAATTVMKSSGDPSGPVTFKGLDGTTDRVRSTMDADGNRTDVELDP